MYRIYQVQKEETLDQIAKNFDVTANLLRELNGFSNDYVVREGERIIVPREPSTFSRYVVKKGDTLYSLAHKHGVTVAQLAMLNGLDDDDYLYVDQVLVVPKENTEFYITEDNDTLTKVASYFQTTPKVLVEQNKTIYLMPEQLIIYKKEKI